LGETTFENPPLGTRQNERNGIQRPRPIRALRIRIDVVSDTILDDEAPCEVECAPGGGAGVDPRDPLDEGAPMRTQLPNLIEQLVVATRLGAITRQRTVRRYGEGFTQLLLRSNVKGCSGLTGSCGGSSGPGVWPIWKNRARRRLSDSKALTG